MKSIITISFFSLLMFSCVIIETPGFYNGYKKLSEEEKKNIVFVNQDSSICVLQNDYKIYAISGKQLRKCIASNDTSVIYQWGPNCSSSNCILISACQDYCKSKNYKLYVVADYYNMKIMDAQNNSDFPILIANHIYYDKYYAIKLNDLFVYDLLNGQKINKDELYKRFMFFKGSEYIGSKRSLF